jgi:phage-related protein
LEASFAPPVEDAEVAAAMEIDEPAAESAPPPTVTPAEPAESKAAPLTTRERIVLSAQAEPAAPVPVAAPVVARAEPAAPEPEPQLEVEEETTALVVALDAEKRRVAARATLAEPDGAAAPDPSEPAALPDNVVLFPVRPPPTEGTAETDAPPAEVEAVARGPPAQAELVLSGTPLVQTKLAVSKPGDALEREADAVAARVVRGGEPAPSPPGRAAGRLQRAVPHPRGPPPAARLPRSVAAVVAAPAGGSALDAGVRTRIEPHLGVDLGAVRVRRDPAAAAAARDLHARAFTSGPTIFLAAESSPADLALMAHEATHVAQQETVPTARTTLMRDATDFLPDVSVDDLVPDWILDGVRDAISAIPGYTLLTYIVGRDPLTDEPVTAGQQELIDTLLTYGPFGPAVGAVLQTIEVLGDIFAFVSESFAENDLTLARISREIEAAWDELSVTNGIAGNVAIVSRYVDAFLRDVRSFVLSIVERVLEIVRSVVAEVAEPLLQTPEIAPVWNLTKKVLHYDPLRGVDVDAPTVEIIADFLRLIGEEERLAQMEERGTLQQTADWLDTQLVTFTSLITELGLLFGEAWAAIQPENLPDLVTNLEALAQRAFGFVLRVAEFGATLILKVLELVKEALLAWLSEHAHTFPGFHLLTVILEQNPFTGEVVPRTAENLIKGFITLLPGGEETYNQLAESGVIGDAASRIEGEMARLGISLEMITGLFLGIWDTLSLDDLLDPIAAFGRILDLFGEPLSRLIQFIRVVIEVVVTLILRLMNFPTELLASVINNTMQAISDIKRDPVAFFLNMVEALKLGFTGFFDNILRYLLDGLVAWLFRGLGQLGITLPADFSLGSILQLVFQVLGLTIEHLWEKLGEHIGPERVQMIRDALNVLSGAWAFIQDVQREGLSAVWRYVADQLGAIWSTLLDMAVEWIMQTIVVNATVKLLSFLDPTGIMAVINSCIAIFNAIQSAIEYLRDMLEVLNQYVSTLAAVAAGNIVPGAQMLEQGLASIIPIAIGFLAKQVGLGNVPEKIVELIGRLREIIDQALDWLIEQALRLGQAALNALGIGRTPEEPPAPTDEGAIHEPFDLAGEDHEIYVGAGGALLVASDGAQPVSNIDRLRDLHNQYTGLPATATTAERRRIIRAMIAIIRQDPSLLAQLATEGLGDPPNLGDVRPHGSQTGRFQPRSGAAQYAPLWEVLSEHVIPRSYVDSFFAAFALGAVTGSEYFAMHTILLYKVASHKKTNLPGGDNTVYQELREAANEIMAAAGESRERARAFDLAESTILNLFEDYSANALERTYEVILEEHDEPNGASTNGAIRGTPPAPPAAKVRDAFHRQAQDVTGMLSRRLT